MSQKRVKLKRYTQYKEINFAFEQKIHFFGEIDKKLKHEKIVFCFVIVVKTTML